jgi:trehalose-6-phosphate synthase
MEQSSLPLSNILSAKDNGLKARGLMNIITYRGPGKAGGLSNSVGQAWYSCADSSDRWWNIGENTLQYLSAFDDTENDVTCIPPELIDGHYKYCNEFLWPVLHNLPTLSLLKSESCKHYDQFNLTVGEALASLFKHTNQLQPTCFIHDYHFALLPKLLKEKANARSVFFWHIPWPKKIDDHVITSQLKNMVAGILHSEGVGFHTNEYAINFIQFVEDNFPEYQCDWDAMSISPQNGMRHTTTVMVAPLGIDYDSWHNLAKQKNDPNFQFKQMPYIFSVDRADYTKGVVNRLEAIDYFFERFPRWQQNVTFVQSCGRTRVGLTAFDQYWDNCHELQIRLNNKWGTEDWRPLVWLDENLPIDKLARLYSDASVMLVNPVRDGLNLTAKEYVACQISNPGVLVLSAGAGVWDELGNFSIKTNPHDPKAIAESINRALSLSPGEKSLRMNLLRAAVQKNNLVAWWFNFRNTLEKPTSPKIIDIRTKRTQVNVRKG